MAKLAKLQRAREGLEGRIWQALVNFANSATPEDFDILATAGMEWISGAGDDIGNCGDIQAGGSMETLAAGYLPYIRDVLKWLSDPEKYGDLAFFAVDLIRLYGTAIEMQWSATGVFESRLDDESLITEWPHKCGYVISPACKFVKDQIDRHDLDGERLRDVIPIGLCDRPGCGRFFLIERIGRKRFCSDLCRVRNASDSMTKQEKAARMQRYRENLKDMASKPIGIAKRSTKPVSKTRGK